MRNTRTFLRAVSRWALAALVLAASPLQAEQSETYESPNSNLSFRTTRLGTMSGYGFYPVKVVATNNGPAESVWDFSYGTNSLGSLKIPAGQSVSTILYIPHVSNGKNSFAAFLEMSERGRNNTNRIYINNYNMRTMAGHSPKLDAEIVKGIENSSRVSEAVTITPNEWPADYRVYSSLAYLVMPKDEYDLLDSARKTAIRQWVAGGGSLYLITLDRGVEKSKLTAEDNIGWGTIRNVSAHDVKRAVEYLGTSFRSGNGTEDYPSIPGSAREYQLNSPAAILIIMLIVFAVIVGPVCLFGWAPAKKRQRLFILVPSISFGFSILLMLLILFIDGTGGKGMRVAAVYLDPSSNSATIKQRQVSKTGLLLNNSFTLDPRAEFYSEFADDSRGGAKKRSFDQFSGDWFGSRSQIDQKLLLNADTRYKVSLVGEENGHPVVQSTIPTGLSKFYYLDKNGIYWTADSLPTGRKVALTRLSNRKPAGINVSKDEFTATGGTSDIAPVDTLGAINWEQDIVTFFGPVVHE